METFMPAPGTNYCGPMLPHFVLTKEITFGAKVMYALLCDYASYFHADNCYPSHSKLAARLSCSISSVKRYLSELAKAKLISIELRSQRSNIYYMLKPDALENADADCKITEVTTHQQDTRTVQDAHRQQFNVAPPQSKVGYVSNLIKKQEENTNPPLPPVTVSRSLPPASGPVGGGGSIFQDFEKAWEAYPKKEAMVPARNAWNQLRQKGLLPPLADLLNVIKRFCCTESWQRDRGRYVPQMSKWLQAQRWLDVLPPDEEKLELHRQETTRVDVVWKQTQENLKAQRKEQNAALVPAYEAFKAQFPVEELNERQEAMLRGKWFHLQTKYHGPTAAEVPGDNTLPILDFMVAYQRRSEEKAYRAAQAVSQTGSREGRPTHCTEVLQRMDFLGRLVPQREALCATA